VNTLFNGCFATVVVPFLLVTLSGIWIVTMYFLIRFHHNLETASSVQMLLVLIFFIVLICIFSPLAASIHFKTTSALSRWKHGTALARREQMVLRSCKAFGIRVGNLYQMQKSTPVTYYRILFDLAIHVLLGTS